jgi:hypothetical protein
MWFEFEKVENVVFFHTSFAIPTPVIAYISVVIHEFDLDAVDVCSIYCF